MKQLKMKKIWFFHWQGDGSSWERGYNYVLASSKKEAIVEINKQFSGCKLVADLTTLKKVSQSFIDKVDKSYSGCFD